MKEDFHHEEKEFITSNFFNDNSTLPPRRSIHSIKKPDKSSDNKLFRVIVSSLFIVIIASIVFFLFFDNFNINLFNSNQEIPEITENEDLNSNIENPIGQEETPEEGTTDLTEEEEITDLTEEEIIDLLEEEPESEESNNQIEPPSTTTDQIHIIQDGENLYRISDKYYGPGYMEALARYNNITDIDKLTAGYKLKIPSIELLN